MTTEQKQLLRELIMTHEQQLEELEEKIKELTDAKPSLIARIAELEERLNNQD